MIRPPDQGHDPKTGAGTFPLPQTGGLRPAKQVFGRNEADRENLLLTRLNACINELIEMGFVPAGAKVVRLHLNEGRIERRSQIGYEGNA